MASVFRAVVARSAAAAAARPAFTRSMATTPVQKKVAPTVFGVTGKLATKLFQEGVKAKNLPAVRSDLRKFKELYESNAELRTLFLNPVISHEQRNSALTEVFKKTGLANAQTQSFIKAAAATKSVGRIKQILSDFEKLVTFELKEIHASVTSAEPLPAAQLKRLEAALKKRIAADEKLLLQVNVQPNILGGLIVLVDQQMLDLSVSGQIRKIDAAIRA